MGIPITGLFEPSGGPGSFDLYSPEDIQAGNLNVQLTLISGGKVVCSGINGQITVQTFAGAPSHSATEGTPCWDSTNDKLYVNNNGTTGWTEVGAGGGVDPIQVQSLARSVLGLLNTSKFSVTGHTHTASEISDFGVAVQSIAHQVMGLAAQRVHTHTMSDIIDYLPVVQSIARAVTGTDGLRFVIAEGKNGGQVIRGGIGASETLVLRSTSNATKGIIYFGIGGPTTAQVDETNEAISARTFTSHVSTGTAPLTITSTTKVTNLNVDLLDGLDSTAFALASHTHTASQITDFTEASQDVIGALLVDSTTIDFTYNDGANTLTTAVKVESDQIILAAQVFGP